MAEEKEKQEQVTEVKDPTQFRIDRVKKIQDMYADEASTDRSLNRTPSYETGRPEIRKAKDVYKLLNDAIGDPSKAVELSKKLYCTNPIYASVINYLSNIFMWRYKVIPHRNYVKSKAKAKKEIKQDEYRLIYNLMLEVVDGLTIETKFPDLLSRLYITGAVYMTTLSDEDNLIVDTLILPNHYCRKVGETQFGTAIIEFDFSYFQKLGLTEDKLNKYFKSFPKEFKKNYLKFLKNPTVRWLPLDPHFSTGILLNEMAIPTFLYLYAGILNYEAYEDNELERNENLLKYLVVQTMPHYEDKLIFEMDEVKELHKSMKKIIDRGDKTRLVTTFGDVHLEHIGEADSALNETLKNAFKAIFNNAGFNSAIFTAESVEALNYSLIRDKGMVWKHVQNLLNFYTIAINNWFDFKEFQADIDILPISPYNYKEDIEIYKNNATLGVGKLDYFIAAGVKQINISDQLHLEDFLNLEDITPMQTSYTQTAEDRLGTNTSKTSNKDKKEANPENEPSGKVEVEESKTTSTKKASEE